MIKYKAMKRYLAFMGDVYYPEGGMDDFVGDFDTINEAREFIEQKVKKDNPFQEQPWGYAWAHIWDTKINHKVWTN